MTPSPWERLRSLVEVDRGARTVISLDGLPEPAAEADSNDQVLLINGADQMQDPARGDRGKNRETQKTDLIFEIVRELNGQVAGEQNDATSFIKPPGERDETLGIEAVF